MNSASRMQARSEGDFFRGQALHSIDRLRDHLQRLDAGRVFAADDLAVVLRLLVHPGRGNDVLGRLQRALSTEPASLLVSQPPDLQNSLFSFGLLPTRTTAGQRAAQVMLLSDWVKSEFLTVMIGKQRKTWTWASFINEYANKWGGAHLDESISPALQVIDSYAFGGYGLSSYFLRIAGVTSWRAAQKTWADGTLRRSGKRLSPHELAAIRITASDGVTDPIDRIEYGEPQFFSYNGDSSDLLLYMSRHASCRARVALGEKLSYDVEFNPADATVVAGETTFQPRVPQPPTLTEADFSQGRKTMLQWRVLTVD